VAVYQTRPVARADKRKRLCHGAQVSRTVIAKTLYATIHHIKVLTVGSALSMRARIKYLSYVAA
jgi:hypothetical protein